MTVYNRIGGGMNKVTLDGKPPKDRINLNKRVFTNYISRKPETIRDVRDVIYSKKTDSYYFISNTSSYKGIYKITLNVHLFEKVKQIDLPSSSILLNMFIRNGDIYVKQGAEIFLFNIETKTYTEIAKNLPDEFYSAKVCLYDRLKDRLIVSIDSKIRSYSFKEKTVTEISNVFPSNNIIRAGAPIIKENKLYFIGVGDMFKDIVTINLDTGIVTEHKNALPAPIKQTYGLGGAKAFFLNNKIHLIGLKDEKYESEFYIFAETDRIDKWEKCGICKNDYDEKTKIAQKDEDTVLIFDFESSSDCYEIKKAYVKE